MEELRCYQVASMAKSNSEFVLTKMAHLAFDHESSIEQKEGRLYNRIQFDIHFSWDE